MDLKLNPNLLRRFEVFAIRRTKGGSLEVRAGIATAERDGTINVTLDVLPIDGQLVLRLPAEVQPSTKPPMRIPVAPAVDTLNMKPAPATLVAPTFTGDVLNGWAHQCHGNLPGDVVANHLDDLRCVCGQPRPSLKVLSELHIEARHPRATGPSATDYQPPEAPRHCTKTPKCWLSFDHAGDCDTQLPF